MLTLPYDFCTKCGGRPIRETLSSLSLSVSPSPQGTDDLITLSSQCWPLDLLPHPLRDLLSQWHAALLKRRLEGPGTNPWWMRAASWLWWELHQVPCSKPWPKTTNCFPSHLI
jgi:hypothetical protein